MIRLVFILSLFLAAPVGAQESLIGPQRDPVDRLLAAVNQARALRDLPPVVLDPRLMEAAQAKSEDAAAHNIFAHQDSQGRGMEQRVQEAGYSYSRLYENLAAGVRGARRVTELWLESPDHRGAMIDPKVVHAGVGYHNGPITLDEGVAYHLWTLILAAPGPGGPFRPLPPISDQAERPEASGADPPG